jgi:hypothetical protein
LQYADDLAIYAVNYDVGNIQQTIQSACASLNGFFLGIGLSISEAKSELVLFSRRHTNPPICVSLNGRSMPVVPNFRYLGVVFDGKLLWGAHVRYIQQKCFKRINFLRSMAGVSWGAHPDVMLILYKGLIRSVLEYGCVAFDRMAGTHILKLERVQYRCLRIALGLMQSTHVQTLEVIGGVPPLRMRFSMLNHRYLISAFSTAGHPLRQELTALSVLNSPKIIKEFSVVEGYNLEPVRSVYDYPLGALLHMPEINDEVE